MFWKELERTKLTIVTDGEPDDLISLLLLQKQGLLRTAAIVVNGWTDPRRKAAHIGDLFGLNPNQLFVGESSSEVFSYDEESDGQALAPWIPDLFCNALILCLAPPRELLTVDPTLLSGSTLALYGGFNLCCLLEAGLAAAKLRALLEGFQRCVYYETRFAVGVHSAVHDPALVKALPIGIQRAIGLWNAHVSARGGLIAKSIAACPTQFVNADTGLCATLLMDRPHCTLQRYRLDWQEGRAVLDHAEGSVEVVVGTDSAAFAQQQLDWLRSLVKG